jgi:hypothetical protein
MTIEPLHALLGTWNLTGRSAGADEDDISGTMTGTLILDDTVLQLTGTMRFGDFEADSLELVWADPASDHYQAHAYSKFGPPLAYRWERHGDTLIHAGSGATYTGTIEQDGDLIVGAWKHDPDQPATPQSDYQATMRRTR